MKVIKFYSIGNLVCTYNDPLNYVIVGGRVGGQQSFAFLMLEGFPRKCNEKIHTGCKIKSRSNASKILD